MTDPVLSVPVPDISDYTDFTALTRLKQGASAGDQDALKQAAAQFEAIFIQMLFKEMRNTQIDGGIFDSSQMRFYEDIQDKQLSDYLAKNGGLGMADVLVTQLSNNQSSSPPLKGSVSTVTARSDPVSVSPLNQSRENELQPAIHTKQDFLRILQPVAQKVSNESGFPTDILISQAALETGWGRNMIQYPMGANSYNLFGIKADHRWDGHVVYSTTREYVDGAAISKIEKFRAYPSYEASMKDYVEFIRSNPRYQSAMNYLDDPGRYFDEIQNAGYATDPHYSRKLQALMEAGLHSPSDQSLKNEESGPLS